VDNGEDAFQSTAISDIQACVIFHGYCNESREVDDHHAKPLDEYGDREPGTDLPPGLPEITGTPGIVRPHVAFGERGVTRSLECEVCGSDACGVFRVRPN